MRFRQLAAAPALLLATLLLQACGSDVEPPETAAQGGDGRVLNASPTGPLRPRDRPKW